MTIQIPCSRVIGVVRSLGWLSPHSAAISLEDYQREVIAGIDRLTQFGYIDAPTSWDTTILRTSRQQTGYLLDEPRYVEDAKLSVEEAGMTHLWIETAKVPAAISIAGAVAQAIIDRFELHGPTPWSVAFSRYDTTYSVPMDIECSFVLGFQSEKDLIWAKMVA